MEVHACAGARGERRSESFGDAAAAADDLVINGIDGHNALAALSPSPTGSPAAVAKRRDTTGRPPSWPS
ncbi:hypothetical protein [Streptomyces sp. Caat 7-52]|uniref:hypothetical protein n=1 Tax=Streptomyces sp. Caat 7-52 TaxID=2949637 RepID=UPI002035010C|nr:hypothetical protein [Streptomyces sp. Caat 7-52]